MEMLIKNGRVLDPGGFIDRQADLVISDGRIKEIREYPKKAETDHEFQAVINADGCIVTPGLIDHHLHLFPLIPNGIPGEAVCFASGVTTAVDAGSTGCMNYEEHRAFAEQGRLRVKQYLNISPLGLSSLPDPEDVSPEAVREDLTEEVLKRYREQIIGLKIRMSKNVVGACGFDALKRTIALAGRLSVPVMVHCTDPPGPMKELLDMLRPSDVLTHMYQNTGYTILDEAGKILPEARAARARGVIFEAADARAHFSYEVGEAAFEQDFLPDVISTDLTRFSMYQRPTSFSLPMQLSKYMNMGLSINEVIKCVTVNPAKLMGLSGKAGCIRKGENADIAIFKIEEREIEFGDRPCYDKKAAYRKGNQLLRPVMTICRGDIVYRDIGF